MSLLFDYKCLCKPGWQGRDCAVYKNPCYSTPCFNGGMCAMFQLKPGDLFPVFECLCPHGLTGDRCQMEINECDSNPCLYGSTCHDKLDDYSCYCQINRWGKHCENVDAEICGTNNPCQEAANCTVLHQDVNSPYAICKCDENHTGKYCQAEIDFCYSKPCYNYGQCVPALGEYECICQKGFTGTLCDIEINECSSNHTCRKAGGTRGACPR